MEAASHRRLHRLYHRLIIIIISSSSMSGGDMKKTHINKTITRNGFNMAFIIMYTTADVKCYIERLTVKYFDKLNVCGYCFH